MSSLDDKEKKLEELALDEEISTKKMSIAQKKAVEREAEKKYGRDWRSILGIAYKSIKPNKEVMQDMYAAGLGDLRDESRIRPRRLR